MDSRFTVDAKILQRRYTTTLLLSALLLLMSITAYGWMTVLTERKALFANIQSTSEELRLSLDATVDVARSHVSTMQNAVEARLTHPELGDSGFVQRMGAASSGSPKDAPFDNLDKSLRAQMGTVYIDPQATLEPQAFRRDMAAVSSMLIGAPGIHAQHKIFQWSYYYDAQARWLLMYPMMSRQELLTMTESKDVTAALKLIFSADGTYPVVATGPTKNPQRDMIWTQPYLDAGGKGMMVSLLAPVYTGNDYVGAIGTDVTLAILDSVLQQHAFLLGRALVIDGAGLLLADSERALKGATKAINIQDIIATVPAQQLVVGNAARVDGPESTWLQLPLRGTSWKLLLEVPHSAVNAHLMGALSPYIAMSVVLLASIFGLGWIQNRRYARPALQLAEYVDTLESEPDRSPPKVPLYWSHWFERVAQTARERRALLAKTIEHAALLEGKVDERTAALSQANDELSTAVKTVKAAQVQLVRSEKLAGLGAMVAGISHELNTPLGNALLMVTTLSESGKNMKHLLQEGLRKSDLERFTADVDQASDVIERNLQTAARLLQRFKEVAVNQTSEQQCTFSLHDVTDGVLIVMSPVTRRQPCVVVNEVPDDIMLDSYPGAVTQILTNLISNACSHAFEGRATGHIHIAAQRTQEGRFLLTVTDDGVGIDAKNLPRIFDPFFTTKMGRGGTGLGLHIVLNAVEEVLGGTIEVSSTPQGTCFSISSPLVAPIKSGTPVS